MKNKIIAIISIAACLPVSASAGIINPDIMSGKKKVIVKSKESDLPAIPKTAPAASGIDFTGDFVRAREEAKPTEKAPVSSRFSDEAAKNRADRFFGSAASGASAPSRSADMGSKAESLTDFLIVAEAEYRKVGDFPQAIENIVTADIRRFSFVRTWFADLRSNYSGKDKQVCQFDYSVMKNSCISTSTEDNPEKRQLISLAYQKAQKANDDGLRASLNYGSSTEKQERATPEEIEKRLIGSK